MATSATTPDADPHACDAPAETPEVKTPAVRDPDDILVEDLAEWLGKALTGECSRAAHSVMEWMQRKGKTPA